MATTIRDIAEDLGISHATVSRVLSGRGAELISAPTRKRVTAAAERLGYRRNHHARALQTGRSDAIGCLHAGAFAGWHGFWGRLVSGVAESARQAGLDLVLIPGPGGPDAVRRGILHLQEQRIDALIVPGVLDAGPQAAELRAVGAPVVIAQPIEAAPPGLPSVSLDPGPGMVAAVAHLAAFGHRALTWLDLPRHSRDDVRRRALRDAARAHGLAWHEEVVDVGRAAWNEAGPVVRGRLGREACAAILAARPETTALVCYNEALAAGACAAAADRGLRVPRDLSVIGFDDHQADALVPALTVVSHMLEAIGRQAADLACAALVPGAPATPASRLVPAELVVRDSTGPAPVR